MHAASPPAYEALGWAQVGLARYSDAALAFQKAAALSRDAQSLMGLAHASARSGETNRVRDLLDELLEQSAREYVPQVSFVIIYAGLGACDRAFEYLERCYEERDPHLFWLPVMPAFAPLRQNPRFDELLIRLKLAT